MDQLKELIENLRYMAGEAGQAVICIPETKHAYDARVNEASAVLEQYVLAQITKASERPPVLPRKAFGYAHVVLDSDGQTSIVLRTRPVLENSVFKVPLYVDAN